MKGTVVPALAWIAVALAILVPAVARAEYVLRAGDTVAVSTLGPVDLAHESVVDSDGRIVLPVAGQVAVAGLPLEEVRTIVSAAMAARPVRIVGDDGAERWMNLQPSEVLVEISQYAPVFVTGAVAAPGRFAYTPGMTVRQLVAEAGGLGVGVLPDDPNARQSVQLAADREVAARELETILTQVARVEEELRVLSDASEPALDEAADTGEPDAAAPVAEAEPEPAPFIALREPGSVRRPRARPVPGTETADNAPPDDAGGLEGLGVEFAEPTGPAPFTANGGSMGDVGRDLVEAGATLRRVEASRSQALLAEISERLELLRLRQADEEALVEYDRAEVARVRDLIERGLVPAAEAAASERTLLMSTMQAYDTADAVARLEIERSRLDAEIARRPTEAARDLLLELEGLLARGDVARAELASLDQRIAMLGGPSVGATTVEFDFVLHRGSGDGATAIPVTQDQLLAPGDVLDVEIVVAGATTP